MVALLLCVEAGAVEPMVVVRSSDDVHVVQGSDILTVEEFALWTGDEPTYRRVERRVDVQRTIHGAGVGVGGATFGTALLTGLVLNGAGNQDAALVAWGVAGAGLGVAATSELAYRRMRRDSYSMTAWYAAPEVRDRVDTWNAAWDVEQPLVVIEDSRDGYSVLVDGRRVRAEEAALQLGDLRTHRRLTRRRGLVITGTWASAHAMTVCGTLAISRVNWGAAPFTVGFLGAGLALGAFASIPRHPMSHQVWSEEEARALSRSVSAEP
ncbi:MAG: hypothetical protein GY913_30970 [Proteobacteria bacterium]|nr:hypothetical protein [Pseudomonadota bacterium]MCP4921340.1 hypothetical protein [Pseudomonadota bacterium]